MGQSSPYVLLLPEAIAVSRTAESKTRLFGVGQIRSAELQLFVCQGTRERFILHYLPPEGFNEF